jgi:hypothetical protein
LDVYTNINIGIDKDILFLCIGIESGIDIVSWDIGLLPMSNIV